MDIFTRGFESSIEQRTNYSEELCFPGIWRYFEWSHRRYLDFELGHSNKILAKKRDIITKLKEKVADMVDILNSQMIVETDRIVIKYRIRTHNGAL